MKFYFEHTSYSAEFRSEVDAVRGPYYGWGRRSYSYGGGYGSTGSDCDSGCDSMGGYSGDDYGWSPPRPWCVGGPARLGFRARLGLHQPPCRFGVSIATPFAQRGAWHAGRCPAEVGG
jgi:hypothetical protein